MRKIVLGAGITALILVSVTMYARLPNSANAFPQTANKATDAYAVESTIDVKALPRYDILSEADD
jgi:hypothetical protein